MTNVVFTQDLPRSDIAVGLVLATGVTAAPAPNALVEATRRTVEARQGELDPRLDARRQACRDMLRNGRYKPTGRGKPANEYLLRAANDGTFPSINGLVDSNNLLSLEHMVPISVWDLDLAQSDRFVFRLGRTEESYVFNAGGQVLDVTDLLCGCAVREAAPDGEPIVNAIKDCLKTKTKDSTTRVAGAIYCPLSALDEARIAEISAELAHWLSLCGEGAKTTSGVLLPGRTVTLTV